MFVPVGNNLIFEVILYIICGLEFKIRVIVVLGFKLLLMGSLGTLAFSWPKFFNCTFGSTVFVTAQCLFRYAFIRAVALSHSNPRRLVYDAWLCGHIIRNSIRSTMWLCWLQLSGCNYADIGARVWLCALDGWMIAGNCDWNGSVPCWRLHVYVLRVSPPGECL